MQSTRHWIMQFLREAAILCAILVVVDFATGVKLADSFWMTLAYALAAAAIFTGFRYHQSRKP